VHESPGRWPAGQAAVRLRNAIISTGLQLHPARHTTGRPALAHVIDGACIPASAGPFLHPSITSSAEWAALAALDDGGAQAAPWTVTLGSLLHPCPLSVSEAVGGVRRLRCDALSALSALPALGLRCAALRSPSALPLKRLGKDKSEVHPLSAVLQGGLSRL
jgi:hypothetical protein